MPRGGRRKGAGRPPIIDGGAEGRTRKNVWFGKELLSRLANWAKAQSDKPTQPEALRRLLNVALKSKGY